MNPRFTVTVSRPGAGENATGQILRALLYAPEDYSVGRITQVTDGVTFGVEEDNSIRAAGVMEEGERAVSSKGGEPGWTFPLRVSSTSGLMISCSG